MYYLVLDDVRVQGLIFASEDQAVASAKALIRGKPRSRIGVFTRDGRQGVVLPNNGIPQYVKQQKK